MATIGLDKLYYAKITEDENGNETYASPVQLAKAMTADLSVELAEATLYADDGASEIVKEFKSGTLSLGVLLRHPTLLGQPSMPTVLWFPQVRMAESLWLWDLEQRNPTASTSITGSIV